MAAPLTPRQLAGLKAKFESIQLAREEFYPDFFETATRLLPDKVSSPRFEFIVRRLWIWVVDDTEDGWEAHFSHYYNTFEAGFDWQAPKGTPPINQALLEETLALWQQFYVEHLKTADAVEIIQNVQRLESHI